MRSRAPNKMLGQEKISTIKFGSLLTQLNYLKKKKNCHPFANKVWDNAMRSRAPNKMLRQEKISTIKFGILLTQLNYLKKMEI